MIYHTDHTDEDEAEHAFLSLAMILDFAQSAQIEDLCPILQPQIQYNMAISQEGLRVGYGAQVGRTLMSYAHPG